MVHLSKRKSHILSFPTKLRVSKNTVLAMCQILKGIQDSSGYWLGPYASKIASSDTCSWFSFRGREELGNVLESSSRLRSGLGSSSLIETPRVSPDRVPNTFCWTTVLSKLDVQISLVHRHDDTSVKVPRQSCLCRVSEDSLAPKNSLVSAYLIRIRIYN